MSEVPARPEELLDDPAGYADDSEPDDTASNEGDPAQLDGWIAPDFDDEGVEYEEGEDDPQGVDPELGVAPGGAATAPIPGPLNPVESWTDVDEDGEFEDLVPESDEPVDGSEELLAEAPEVDEEDENATQDQGPHWVKYEVYGRDRNEDLEWAWLSTQDYGIDVEAEIENLRTGTQMEFRVRLLSSTGIYSEWSDAFNYTLPSDLTPPPAPTAPTASDNSGFITHTHDGTFTGPIPPDMSHRVLYAQQMEPSEGDPMRLTEWRGVDASTFTTGRYLDQVEHRAWLIAVDTTGNESTRSEYVYFTPSQPVDAQRINDELASISDRVGSGFNQSLADAIEDIDSSIDRLVVGELFVPGAIKAVSIDVQDLAVDEARMNQLWAGFAGISEAQIDNLLGNTAKFKTINAPFIQSHTAENVGWKLRPTGEFEVYGANDLAGEPQIKVGASAAAGDLITLRDEEGNPSVSMSSSGGLSAIHLSSDDDPHFGGKALAGRHFNTARWNVVDNVLDHGPLGVLKHYRHSFNGRVDSASGSQAGMAVMHLEERIRPGRLYRIRCDDFEMGNRASYWMEAFYTTSSNPNVRPDVPTQLASEPTVWMPRIPGRVPVSADSTGTVLSYDKVIDNTSAVWLRVIFSVGNTTGVSNTFGSGFRRSAHFTLEDIGPSTGQKGYPLNRGIRTRDEVGPELAEDLSVTYPTVDTATYTLNTSTGVATRQYLGGEPRFGRWSNGTYYMTLARQDSWSTQPGVRSGAQFQLAVGSWLNPGRGHIVQQGIPTFNGFPASFNYETQVIGMPNQLNVPRWSPRLVAPEGSALSTLLGKEQAMIAVGRTGYASLTEGLPASGRLSSANTNARLATGI